MISMLQSIHIVSLRSQYSSIVIETSLTCCFS